MWNTLPLSAFYASSAFRLLVLRLFFSARQVSLNSRHSPFPVRPLMRKTSLPRPKLSDPVQRITHATRQYGRAQLLLATPVHLSTDLISRLRVLRLGAGLPRKRTRRGGVRKQTHRIGPVITPGRNGTNPCPPAHQTPSSKQKPSANLDNLIRIPLTRSPPDRTLNGLKVASFNAQSVGPTCKEKRTEINTFIIESDLDLLFIVETWLRQRGDEAFCADLTPSGYSIKSFPRSYGKRGGGGIAVIYRNSLTPLLTFIDKFSFDHTAYELLQVSLMSQHSVLHFMCVYRPGPTSANKHRLTVALFFDEFPDFLDHCNALHGHLCVLGDFNFHVNDLSDRKSVKFLDLLFTYNLCQMVVGPTHRRGHTLDLVIVRPLDAVHRSSDATPALESDHLCVVSEFDLALPSPAPMYRDVRNIRGIDRALLGEDLRTELSRLETCTADQYNATLRSILDRHAPVSRRRVTERKVPSPWFSLLGDELCVAKRKRRQAEDQWRQTRLTVHKQIYQKAKNCVTFLVDTAKSLFYNTSISEAKSSKELYNIINRLCARSKTIHLPTIFPLPALPDMFSDFFCSKVDKIRTDLDDQMTVAHPLGKPFCGDPFLSFSSVSEDDVLKILKKSAPKTCDLDPIPTPLLYDCVDYILPFLTRMINHSLLTGVFPDIHKTAIVTPLLKKPTLNVNDLKNFRPVSNLSFVSKLIEKIVLLQLSNHLSLNQLLNPYQSAYRPEHSTETALLKVINDLLLSLDDGKVSILTLLDLSAAFDTIDHSTLLSRLEHVFGVSGIVLNWFRSYLSDRTQSVSVQNFKSNPVLVSYGVPQGSVLGPVLFVLYMSPLTDLILSHSVLPHSYADDTQLQKSSEPDRVNELVQTMQECISDVKSWMTFNRLKLNDEKTEALIISSKRTSLPTPLPTELVVGDASVPFSKSAKNLGVVLDSHLTMNAQVGNVIRSVNLELRRISSIRHFLTVEATKTLIAAFVLSRLDYCNSLLVNCPRDLLSRLQRIQNSAARLVLKTPRRDHITPHLYSLHWLPIDARIKYKIACMCFRAINGTGPDYLAGLVQMYTPSRTLRSSSDTFTLSKPRTFTKTYGERSFSGSAPAIWNSLPLSIRSALTDSAFRSALKTHLFQEFFVL